MAGKADTYTLAVIANFAVGLRKDRDFTRRAMQPLLDARTEKGDKVWWTPRDRRLLHRRSAAIETTGLAVQALLKWGQASEIARKALNYICFQEGCLRQLGHHAGHDHGPARAVASRRNTARRRPRTVQVLLNGKTVETLQLTPENNDLLHQFVFKGIDAQKANSVQTQV